MNHTHLTTTLDVTDHPRLVDDPRPALTESAAVALAVVGTITTDHAERATPAGMSVGELVPHLVMAMRRLKSCADNQPIEDWAQDAPDVNVENGAERLAVALEEAETAWADDALLDRPRPLPWEPTALGSESLACYVSELVVHTWDLARGIGAQPTWSDETIATAYAVMRKQLPIADRTPMWQAMAEQFGVGPDEIEQFAPFANAVPVADDAPALNRLLAWVGRDPS